MKKLFLLMLLSLNSCAFTFPEKTKTVFDYPADKEIKWVECFDQKDELYYVYFYSNTCGHCKELKDTLLTYYYTHDDAFYFVNVETYAVFQNNPETLIGISDINKLFIVGTPFLLEVSFHSITSYYGGVNAIKILLASK